MNAHGTYAFIGVSGMGMAPLALYMSDAGYAVAGYDDAWRASLRRLFERRRLPLFDQPVLPADTVCVVHSSAVDPDHPCLQEARRRGIETIRRGTMLARLAQSKKLLAVAGSHGKTTTAGMLIWALHRLAIPADYVLGGLYQRQALPPGFSGANEWLVAEIDESDGTLEDFQPELTVLLNWDWDHSDRYPQATDFEQALARLARRTKRCVLVPEQASFLKGLSTLRTVSREGDYAWNLHSGDTEKLMLKLSGAFPDCHALVQARGSFNAANAAAALAALCAMPLPASPLAGDGLCRSLEDFPGIERRQSFLHEDPQMTILADYAHHPHEISELLQFCRRLQPASQLEVVFQPHRYSRTRRFAPAFAEALQIAHTVHLLEVYAAAEKPGDLQSTAEAIRAFFPELRKPTIFHDQNALFQQIERPHAVSSRLIVFIGAGDIESWAQNFANHRRLRFAHTAPDHSVRQWRDLHASCSPQTVLRADEPLAPKTTMRVGGKARFYAEPANTEDLQTLLRFRMEQGLPFFLIGRGSNLLVGDEGFNGLVLRLAGPFWQEMTPLNAETLYVRSGARLKAVCAQARQLGWSGLEFLEGIPGTLGGSLRMNAGAMGSWIFEVVRSVDLMDLNGQKFTLSREQLHPAYRNCPELKQAIALGACLAPVSRADSESIRSRMDDFAAHRKASQPRDPSAGCIFKNPPGDHAGRLIDSLGLKGTAVGDAVVSPIHANFIVNQGDASCADIIELVRHIRAEVRLRTGHILEPEALLLGLSWKEVLA